MGLINLVKKKTENNEAKVVKSIPSSETGSRTICFTKPNELGDKYIITQNPLKEQFTLWKIYEDGFEKITTSDSPLDFDDIIPWENKYMPVAQ